MSNLLQIPEFVDLKSRLTERLGGASALQSTADWICAHTRIKDRKFSFKDHEFQKAIADDLSPTVVAQKPTQVGFTELSVRIMLALCAIRRNFQVIYVLPSAKFAGEFAKTRVDPIIETSTRLRAMMVRGADGAMMKRIGTSTMYMGGAATKQQAISRPADCLIMDEVDFANQEVLTSYEGRLAHTLDPMRRKFSTPTLSDYGINKALLLSDRMRYMVLCRSCNEWQAPDFNTNVWVPGFSEVHEKFREFSKEYLTSPDVDISKAYIRCPKCSADLTKDLSNPERRQWVATNIRTQLDRGYEIKPFDIPLYNPVSDLIRRFGNYADEEDYWNFAQGEVYDSDTNQVSPTIVGNCFSLPPAEAVDDLCMGVDVGKTRCHVMVGAKGKVFFRHVLRIEDGEFHRQISALFHKYKCIQGVIDIGPEASIGRMLREKFGDWWYMCAYRKDIAADPWYYTVQEGNGVVSMQRTKGFNMLVKSLNSSQWQFCPGPDKVTVVSQFTGMKRVRKLGDDESGRDSVWEKVGDDHYLHALMYLQVALDVANGDHSAVSSGVPVLPGISGVNLGSSRVSAGHTSALRNTFLRYGVR